MAYPQRQIALIGCVLPIQMQNNFTDYKDCWSAGWSDFIVLEQFDLHLIGTREPPFFK